MVLVFTFHYVSISTCPVLFLFVFHSHLHSTMYLFQLECKIEELTREVIYIPLCIYFNPVACVIYPDGYKFTFHYVSISTQSNVTLENCTIKFTFHYVSISTRIFKTFISIRLVVALLSTKQTSIIFILTCSGNIRISTDKIRIVDLLVILQYYASTVKA